jgi:MFS family permease
MKNPFFKVLAIPSFSFLLVSESFSQIAVNLMNFILLIVVFNITGSSTAVAGVVLSFMIPPLLFGILAGVYVDRLNKRNVLIATNILRALFTIPLFFFYQSIVPVYVFSFLVTTVTQFYIPAETPVIPLLVKKELLLPANALFSVIIFGSILIAYAISGPVVLVVGEKNIFVILTVLFLASSLFAALIRIHKKDQTIKAVEKIGLFKDAKNAFAIIIKTKKIYRALFLMTFLQVLILMIAVIGPGYAKDVLHIKVEAFSVLFVIPAVSGMAVGAFLIGNFLHTKPKSVITKIGLFIMGVTLLLFPYGSKVASRELVQTLNTSLPNLFEVNIIHIMVVLAFILGFSFALVFIPSNTIIQEETTDEFRGKVYGTLNTLVGACAIIPVLAVGSFADIFGVGKVLTGMGIAILVIAFIRLIEK